MERGQKRKAGAKESCTIVTCVAAAIAGQSDADFQDAVFCTEVDRPPWQRPGVRRTRVSIHVTVYSQACIYLLSDLDRLFTVRYALCTHAYSHFISTHGVKLTLTPTHWRRQGGLSPSLNGRAKKNFFVKIEGLLEPVVLNLSFRVRSNAMFTYERRYQCYRYTQNIKNNLKLSALFLQN